jgi:hypothetical protein
MGHRPSHGSFEPKDDPSRAMGYMPFLMVYDTETVLLINLDYPE